MPAAITVALLLSLFLLSNPKPITKSSAKVGRNSAPNGAHYNLNVIGVPKGKTSDLSGSMGRRIFVPLIGNCKINLSIGDFQVLDANCTDNGQSSFQLPNPDPDNDGMTAYSVWARALGKPGGSSETTTCAYDVDGALWCSVYSNVEVRNKGKSSFTDVSRQLLYIYADIDSDGSLEKYNLFNDTLQDYYWNYDNNGLKLMQLRFYEIPSIVN